MSDPTLGRLLFDYFDRGEDYDPDAIAEGISALLEREQVKRFQENPQLIDETYARLLALHEKFRAVDSLKLMRLLALLGFNVQSKGGRAQASRWDGASGEPPEILNFLIRKDHPHYAVEMSATFEQLQKITGRPEERLLEELALDSALDSAKNTQETEIPNVD